MSFCRSRRGLGVCASALLVALLLWRPGADRFRARLEQSLGSALGHKVEIGNVSLQILPRPGFHLSQLSVRDDPQFSLEPILRADEVSATLHPSSLWRWRIEIANLSFKDASLNLVRRADGRWNLEPLLERAAHVPAAPTGNATAEARRRFPYIEVSNGRVNFKLGPEKMPYTLTDADLALFLDSNDEWGMRLRGQPVRTDMRLSDTGILRANATWRRAEDLRKTPLRLSASYEGAQLGQLTKLLYGTDKGWRGTVSATLTLAGSVEDLQIQSEAAVDSFRRYDILLGPSLRLAATCSAHYGMAPPQLSGILCSTPADDGSLILRGKLALVSPPVYDLNLNASKFPAQRVAEVLRAVKKGLVEDLTASGTVHADLSFEADGSRAVTWSGSGGTDHLILYASALQAKNTGNTLALGSVPFRATSASPTRHGKGLEAPGKANDVALSERAIELGPVTASLAAGQDARFHAWFSAMGFRASFAGDAPIQRLLQIARATGTTAIHPALEGDTKFDWQAQGLWGVFSQPQTTATLHLRNVRAEFPGLNAPIEIAAGDVSLSPDTFQLDKLSANAGGIHWSGSLTRPRVCPGTGTCATQIDLHAEEIPVEKVNALLNPNVHKQPWYRILTGNPRQTGAALQALNVRGRIQVDRLVLGEVTASGVTARVQLADGGLHLSELRGSVLGGHHIGDWQADFTRDPPEYTVTGALENLALLQVARLTRSSWITGTSRATYSLTFSGWNAADLQSSLRGNATLNSQDGSLPRFGPGGSPVTFSQLQAELTTGKSLLVISQGNLENSQGRYNISGVASFARKLDLKFQKSNGHGFAVAGTLEEPHIEVLAPIQAMK